MKNYLTHVAVLLVFTAVLIPVQDIYAQEAAISGKVSDAQTNEPLTGVNIAVKGKLIGTVTDAKGNFTLRTTAAFPFTMVVSSVGYKTQETEITSHDQQLHITLHEQIIMGQDVVVAASRMEESILQSPVSVEKMDIRSIRETPSANFYEALGNVKGIDVNTQSLTFRAVNTRGFNANVNTRMVQLIDGMDNQAPGLNFAVGNIVGISELDLESIEVLPGASSALYGPNAIQGIILMNSKNPFQYQGLSVAAKTGWMNLGKTGTDPSLLHDYSIRYAKAIGNRFAFKMNASYLRAQDWQATDDRDKNAGLRAGSNRQTNPNYNGVNIYGDENSGNMQVVATDKDFIEAVLNPISAASGLTVAQLQGMIPGQDITRTGYQEKDLVDYTTESVKLNAALHYRLTNNIEAILQANYGTGTTVHTGIDRYSFTNFDLGQFKAELKGSHFFLRGYTTQERSGDSYSGGTLGVFLNEAYSPSVSDWFPTYTASYLQARLGILPGGQQNNEQAHITARSIADRNRLIPETPAFEAAKNQIINKPIPQGARFTDKTNLYHLEGMYNLNQLTHVAEIIVGANYRVYDLNSEGTLFLQKSDGKEYTIKEYGGYIQAARKLLADHLKITGSIRYDKNENFKGQFTPRLSGVFTFASTHNVRLSYQTGFRIPTTQDQYIDLNTPQARLIGGLPVFQERYHMTTNPVYSLANVQAAGKLLQETGDIEKAIQALKPYQFKAYKPERVKSYEIGYRSLIANKLMLDAYYYYNQYTNFSGQQLVVQSNPVEGPATPLALFGIGGTSTAYLFPENSEGKIKAHGWALGMDYALPGGFTVGGNVAYNALIAGDKNLVLTQFNTPRYRSNINFGNRNVFKNVGFNMVWRWQDAFLWESSFTLPATNTIVPAFSTFDAQVSYKITPIKSVLKVGGSNLFNKYYTQAFGNPAVGGLYYVSLTFDQLLR